MNKQLKLITIIVMLILILSTPVHASLWSSLLKTITKKGEKAVIKQVENGFVEKKQKEFVEKDGKFLVKQEEENVIKKQEQVKVNKLEGDLLDDSFKVSWCQKHKCANSMQDIRKIEQSEGSFYITNDYVANKYINEKLDKSFTRRPDMLEVKVNSKGSLENIVIYDVKTSSEAALAAEKRGQTGDYIRLCERQNRIRGAGFCDVQYVLPKEEAEVFAKTTGNEVLTCLVIGMLLGPDPTDILCLVGI